MYLREALGSRVSCSFDQPSGLCEWNSDSEAPFHWRVGQGRSEDHVSGPRNDHTCQNKRGHYLYIAGKDADKGADATVWSPAVTLNHSQFFTFWYTMNGYGTGNLSLLRLENNSSVVLWSKAGHQSVSWLSANVTLNPGMFSLQFKATVRLPIASNLAIDDLHLLTEESQSLVKSYCKIPTMTAATIPPRATINTTKSTTPPPVKVPTMCGSNESDLFKLPAACDFEKTTCELVVVANDIDPLVTWTRTNQPHGKRGTNDIPGDHTHEVNKTAKGFYMDFQNNRGLGNFWKNPKYSASLQTPCIYSYSVCLTFWYSIPSDYSNLRVLLKENTGLTHELWRRDNEQKKDDPSKFRNQTGWHEAILSVQGVPPYVIIFQTNNNFHVAVVGIDDITLTASNDSILSTEPVCTSPSIPTTPGTTNTEQPIIPATPVLEPNTAVRTVTSATNMPVVSTTMYTVTSATSEPNTSTKESPSTVTEMSATTQATRTQATRTQATRKQAATTQATLTQATRTQATRTQATRTTTQATRTQHTTSKPDETSSSKFTKKPSTPTKKPPDAVGGNKDEQYGDKQNADKQRSNVSRIVGYSVGSVLAVLLVAVLLYMVVSLRKGAGKSRVKPGARSALQLNQKAFDSNKTADFKIIGQIDNGCAKHADMNSGSTHLEHHTSISEAKSVDTTVETNVISTVTDDYETP